MTKTSKKKKLLQLEELKDELATENAKLWKASDCGRKEIPFILTTFALSLEARIKKIENELEE